MSVWTGLQENFLFKFCKKIANEGGNKGVSKFILCPLSKVCRCLTGVSLFWNPANVISK